MADTRKEPPSKKKCLRLRYKCSYCKQSLAYATYQRHLQLPHLYCPARKQENESSTGSDSTFDFSDSSLTAPDSTIFLDNGRTCSSGTESSSLSSESDSAPEVWEPSNSSSESDSESDNGGEQQRQTALQYMFCVFLSFFQLSFRISDRALAYLLSFLSALFSYFSSQVKDASLLNKFSTSCPRTLHSMKKVLKVKKLYKKYVVCPRCHHSYKQSSCIVTVQGEQVSLKCDFTKFPNHPRPSHRKACGSSLMKKVKIGQKYKLVPKKTFIHYSIIESLQRLVESPGFLESCEEWRDRKIATGVLADVYDGNIWKEWMRIDDVPFLEMPGNFVFMLNLDWFQPFVHTQYSVGVIYLVIQNLPRRLRFKPENIIIVATIPGPTEPSCEDLNPYLEYMVDDLLKLWNGVELRTPSSNICSKLIRAALVYISSDLPATRKVCGFYGIKAKFGCSKCLKCFPSTSIAFTNYSGFDRDKWPPRTLEGHISHINQAKAATNQSAREKKEKEIGARYSELLRLKYFDIVRCHLVDPMHNLFLGTSKRLIKIWKEQNILTDKDFEDIQNQIDNINPPANIGRLPYKISARFAGFTAEQWMLWTTLYSPLILHHFLPEDNYANWCLFSRACFILCRSHICLSAVYEADALLLKFCQTFQDLYGEEECTPNMHMHCHLKDCIMDVGPLHSFWCFSFERYNGILESMQKSWHAPELTLVQKFCSLQTLSSINLPADIPTELQRSFIQMKHTKSALPDTIIDSLIVYNYEENMLCFPNKMCAKKLDFQSPIPPGKEKYLNEDKRDILADMYAAIYGQENVSHVPLHYEEFREVKVFETLYISSKSRSTRSPTIAAVWPCPSGILSNRVPSGEDIRIGTIQHFLVHNPSIKLPDQEGNTTEIPHILVEIEWSQDHPRKFHFGNGIIIASTVSQPFSSASFMPISRVISRCAIVDKIIQLDYGEDSLRIAIPIQYHGILFHE